MTKLLKMRKQKIVKDNSSAKNEILKVKVVQCSSNEWYARFVGRTTQVKDFSANQYQLVQNVTPDIVTLLKADCLVM